MKKFILSLVGLLFVLLAVHVNAQQPRTLWLHGAAGINSNWILNQNAYGNQEMEYATSFSISGVAGFSYFYNKKWGVGGSVNMSNIGQSYSGIQAGAEAKRSVKIHYIEVPFTLMRQIPYMNYPTWVSAGPDFLILVKAKQDYSRVGGSPLPNPDGMAVGDITERFNPVDIAFTVSANRMVELNYFRSIMFLLSVNSTFGLTDINAREWRIANTHDIYARSQNFYIGVKIGLMFKVARFGGSRW